MKLSIPHVSLIYIQNKNFRRQCPLNLFDFPGTLLMFIRATRKVNWVPIWRHLGQWFRGFLCVIKYTMQDMALPIGWGWRPWKQLTQVIYFNHKSAQMNSNFFFNKYTLVVLNNIALFELIGILPKLLSNFLVQWQDNHRFSAVACDQTIEQTINRNSKTKGGVLGFLMNPTLVHQWLLLQSERAAITERCKSMAGVDREQWYVQYNRKNPSRIVLVIYFWQILNMLKKKHCIAYV